MANLSSVCNNIADVFFGRKYTFIFLAFKCCDAIAQTSNTESATTLFTIKSVSSMYQLHVTANEMHGKTLLSCAFHCQNLDFQSFYYIERNSTCFCSSADNSVGENENNGAQIIHGIRTKTVSTTYIQVNGQNLKRVHKQPEPFDCLTLYDQGFHENGVYVINPTGSTNTDVWCDMANGGWTVIQCRQDGSEDFYKNWEDYKYGFGIKFGEYWLGLENIYYLTNQSSSLYIYMETFTHDNADPVSAFAGYSIFRINDESDKYRLTVGGYNGSCGDSMLYHNNCQFTTKDSDNDIYGTNCAVVYSGAWWYKACHRANLNGLYLDGADTDFGRGINWETCWGHYYSLKLTLMKIKRTN